jgi:fructokinase
MKIGCIEAGGTKFVCAIIDEKRLILEKITIPTSTPEETFKEMFDFFDRFELDAMGIASFGPIDLNRESKTYGFFTTTPKPGWAFTSFASVFKERYKVPVGFDTDVNAAALAELKYGAGVGSDHLVYFTIGTGIGGGVIVNNQMVHGMMHPEFGHILVKKHPRDDFKGVCPYHGDCLEGMASGVSMEQRWGIKGHLLSADHEAWDIEAYYIAQACVNAVMSVSPQKIVLGGGVMNQEHLFDLIREHVKEMLNGYIQSPLIEDLSNYIVPPGLGEQAGIMGAYALAFEELEK